MAERKAVNKYIPSDFDPGKHGSVNKYRKSHPLRERARKLDQGILIIRFELPYNIWCEGCNNHIGMGVRYNAEKSKTGMYYSTPIYKFRMKCHLCDSHFEMQTDPANLDYVILSGARRQENRWDPSENEQIVPDDKNDIKKMATDAMFRLEHATEDREKVTSLAPVIEKLQDLQESRWKDDFSANQLLRRNLRSQKYKEMDEKKKDDSLLKRLSLGIKLVPESPDDVKLSSLIKYEPTETFEEKRESIRNRIIKEPIFKLKEDPIIDPKVNKQFVEIAKSIAIKKIEEDESSLSREKLGISLAKPNASSSTATKSLVPYQSDQSDSD